ncbi:DUF4296 domain-containing protein [Flavobacterium sp. RHBU_24]|uniref:DUF4296 domain-containing protein n=1 Tax=Flavobacterium sp. RHBU_24 TaxID=3391185 RepID=UPI003984BA5C
MKKLVFIIVALIAVACNNNLVPKPDKIIEEDKMENILYDIALIQGIKSYKPALLDSNGVDPRTYIYKKYAIDSLTLAQNHTWYAANLEKYGKMQGNVVNRLKADREKLDKPIKKKSKKNTAPNAVLDQEQKNRMMQRKQELLRRRNPGAVNK